MAEEYLFNTEINVDVKKASSSIMSLMNRLVKASYKSEELRKKLAQIGENRVKTEAYVQLEKELEMAENELAKLLKKQEAMTKIGFNVGTLFIDDEIEASDKIDEIKAKMEEMKENGTDALISEEAQDEYRKVNEQLRESVVNEKILKKKIGETEAKAKKTTHHFRNLTNSIKKLAGGIMARVSKHFSKTADSAKRLGASVKQLVLAGIGIRTLFSLVSKLKAYMNEGLQNLSKYSKEYNANMSALKSQTAMLKNNLATMAEPILNRVIPVVVQLVSWMNSAINSATRLMAVLGGKSTYTKAKAQIVDYAKTVGSATKQITASFDDLNVLNQDSGGGGGELTGADAFEEAEVGELSAFDTAFKDAIERGDWDGVGGLLAGKLNDVIKKIGEADLGTKLANKLNNVFSFAFGFLSTFDFNNTGAVVGQIINGFITNFDAGKMGATFSALVLGIQGFLISAIEEVNPRTVGQRINDFFANINFKDIANNTSELVTGIFNWISTAIDEVHWDDLGHDLADFFMNLEWGDILVGALELGGKLLTAIKDFAQGVGVAIMNPIFGGMMNVIEKMLDVLAPGWRENTFIDGSIGYNIKDIVDRARVDAYILENEFEQIEDEEIYSRLQAKREERVITDIEELEALYGDRIGDAYENAEAQAETMAEGIVDSTFDVMSETIETDFDDVSNEFSYQYATLETETESTSNRMAQSFETASDRIKKSIGGALAEIGRQMNNTTFNITTGAMGSLKLSANVPKLANGGITVGRTFAQIGEAGREAVLPLENNTGWMDSLADKLASRMPSGSGEVVLTMDGTTLARASIPYFNREENRIGMRLATN